MVNSAITKLTAQIVAAYLKHNELPPEEVATVIEQVHHSLSGLNSIDGASVPSKLVPAIPIRRSLTETEIYCLECGYKAKMLKRHLQAQHSMSPDAYRKRWGLPEDYTLVARGYSERRSALAKKIGLGRLRGKHRGQMPPAETVTPRRGRLRRVMAG